MFSVPNRAMSSPHKIIASLTRLETSFWSPRVTRTSSLAASSLRTAAALRSPWLPYELTSSSSSTKPSPSSTSCTRTLHSGVRTFTAPRCKRRAPRRRAASMSSVRPSCLLGSSASIRPASSSETACLTTTVLVPTQYSSATPCSSMTAVTDTAHRGDPGFNDIKSVATGRGNMGRTPRGAYPLAALVSASVAIGVPSSTQRVASAMCTHTRILPSGSASADTASSTSSVPSPSIA